MDLLTLAVILFYGTVIEAREFLRTGRGDTMIIPENNSKKDPSEVLALLILEHNEEPGESSPPNKYKNQIMLPWIETLKPKNNDMGSSGESNSDEYPDSDIGTYRETNYHQEYDCIKDTIQGINLSDFVHGNAKALRKRWKSCKKKAAKVCQEACEVSYKNACDAYKCKKKLKKTFKKECKRNCKDFFMS